MYVSHQCSPNRRIHVTGMNVTNISFKYLNTIYPLIWWQTTAAVENDENSIIQITDRCLFVSKHEALYIIWSCRKQLNIFSINITSKVAQYMKIDEITNDIHIALDTSDMLQPAHVIMFRWWLQKNRWRWIGTSLTVTTILNRLWLQCHMDHITQYTYISHDRH